MAGESKSIRLEESLSTAQADPLKQAISAHRGDSLLLDASAVTFVGSQCLHVLVAAARAWEAEGHDFTVDSPSEEFSQDLAHYGFAVDKLSGSGETA